MNSFKKHISFFLLIAFVWVILPVSLSHELFADHEDTLCDFDHQGSLQVESKHTHCEIFKINSPVYESPELVVFTAPQRVLISEITCDLNEFHFLDTSFKLPARAPPSADFLKA